MKKSYLYLVVFLFGALIYANTIPNRYAYDDYSVIHENHFTRQGLNGISGHLFNDSFFGFTGQKNLFRGGRYRPLSLITFSVEYAAFGENPHISHLVNVILFGLICLLLLKVLSTLFKDKMSFKSFRDCFLSVSFLSVLVYACHPIHTEVVANIKGRDELMALLFALLAWDSILKYAASSKPGRAALAGMYFFLAMMSKESSAPFLLLIPLSVYCFRSDKVFRKSFVATSVSLLAGFLLFMLIRQTVIGWSSKPSMPDNILSNAFMYASGFSERYGTTFYTLGLYLKLLIFPHPLTIDYYPFYIPYVGLSSLRAILPIIIYAGLTTGSIFFAYRKNVAGYGLLFYLVAILPVSNLLFSVGPFMGERFAFIPSVGFILAVVWLIMKGAEKLNLAKTVPFIFGLILILFTVKTISRNFEWKDNFTLYTTDVQTSKNSAIITRAAGQEILIRLETEKDTVKFKKYVQLAVGYLEQAEKMNKSETETLLLGNAYFNNSEYEKALNMYSETLKLDKNYAKAYGNYLVAVEKIPDPELKIRYYNQLIRIAGARFEPFLQKGVVYGKQMNNLDSALVNLNNAFGFDSTNLECLSSLGVAYAMKGDFRKSAYYLEKGYRINPNDNNIANNLIVTLTNLGEKERVQQLISRQQARR
jgi:tetratricopeptide (TPR) repeat protein